MRPGNRAASLPNFVLVNASDPLVVLHCNFKGKCHRLYTRDYVWALHLRRLDVVVVQLLYNCMHAHTMTTACLENAARRMPACNLCPRSFARAVKGCNVFSREHLAEFFARAYLTLPVQSRTLENLANFKDLVKPVTRRIHDITKFHAFRIHKEGSAVLVEVKEKVHHPNWLGFSADGKTVGTGEGFKGWRLMRVGSVRLEGAPPYLLKVVDPTIIRQIELRQQASWQRLPAAFPGGCRQRLFRFFFFFFFWRRSCGSSL